MNKTELLTHLEARLGSRDAAVAALDAVLAEIQGAVAAGDRVVLTGFGTFETVARAARTGRDPRTGEALAIAASTTPRFRAGAGLRAAVAGGGTTARVARPRAAAPRAETSETAVERTEAGVVGKGAVTGKGARSAKPTKSEKSVKPAKSAKSAKPTKPAKAVKPTKSEKSAKPTKSAKAVKPAKPAKKSGSAAQNTKGK